MKTKKLRLLSILLMLCMVFSLMPLTVFATEEYMLWVNGERFSSSKLEIVCGDGIAIYDTTTKTLTLKDATITSGDHASRGIDS